MREIRETTLPGVGVRFDFEIESGDLISVLVHRGGRRELMVHDADDPDTCSTVLSLTFDETRTLAELLGASRVSEVSSRVEQDIEGLAIDWLTIPAHSPVIGESIGSAMFRTHTGVSIVAVIHDDETHPSPTPDYVFRAGDVLVVVGTSRDIESAWAMLSR